MDKKWEEQVLQVIDIIRENASGNSLDYFYKLWIEYWFGEDKTNTDYIGVIDAGAPELYIRASGAKPLFLFGGCFLTDKYTEHIFPQLSNPVVKSACSLLFSKRVVNSQNITALVVPVKNVDTRKVLPYLKELGYPVITLEQDMLWASKAALQFQSSQMSFVRKLQKVTKHTITRKRIYAAAEQITKAMVSLNRLEQTNMPEIVRSFIRQTYYLAPDIGEWAQVIDSLACGKSQSKREHSPQQLLMGSPIYLPNIKITSILHHVGINNYTNRCGVPYPEDYSGLLNRRALTDRTLYKQLHEIHYQTARKDFAHSLCSDTSFLQNYDGVIYHLLKGQLTYAYEAQRVEKAALGAGIPFVCIETDYTNADTEQIRIRLEAFSELLTQEGRLHAD